MVYAEKNFIHVGKNTVFLNYYGSCPYMVHFRYKVGEMKIQRGYPHNTFNDAIDQATYLSDLYGIEYTVEDGLL